MSKSALDRFLLDFPKAILDDSGAIFIGAGVSVSAGYPSWIELLQEIGDELGIDSRDVHDLAALAQWSVLHHGGYSRIRRIVREHLSATKPIPTSLQVVARLPIKHLWTTNYDRLIERAFEEIGRPIEPISAAPGLAVRARPGAARLYKMHGSVDRLDDIVIATDDYELFRSTRGPYLPLLQAHLTSMSVLFVGLSFTDPNIRHVLSLIRESFTDAPPEHYAIVRPPQRESFKTEDEFRARLLQHNLWAKDLLRYGLRAVEIDEYDQVPELLKQVERHVARQRVWVSGSWPSNGASSTASQIYSIAEALGREIGDQGLSLVSGSGLFVGPATVSGFLDSLRSRGGWDLERRLIVRPFPQSLDGKTAMPAHWTALRQELARLSGVVVFVGGSKLDDGQLVTAKGVLEEAELAEKAGAFLLPIAATGGAAKEIAEKLIGSDIPSSGSASMRPSDEELRALADSRADPEKIVTIVSSILKRTAKYSRAG